MRELENMQNDNTKMYEAVKKIKRLKPSQKLLIKEKDELTANPTEQSKIVAEYLKKSFSKNKQSIEPYHQHKWQYPLLQMKSEK